MRSRSFLVTSVLFASIVGLAAWIWPDPVGASGTGEQGATQRVRSLKLRSEKLRSVLVAGGFLEAVHDITIAAERAGRLVALPIAEGGAVARGDVVARLDDTTARARLARAVSAHREATLDPQTPAASLAQSESELTVARYELGLHGPTAPIDGEIEVHHLDVGEYVRAGTPLVDIVDRRRVILFVEVDAEALAVLRPGAEVSVIIASVSPEMYMGTITRIAGRADRGTRRYRVEIELDSQGGRLRSGQHAEARFPVADTEPSIHVPKDVVRKRHGETGVFVLRDGVVRWLAVRTAPVHTRPDLWRIAADGLADDMRIVRSGFQGLRDGVAVEVSE